MAEQIHDGYTESATIHGIDFLHPSLTFKYRSAISEEVAELYDKAPKQTGPQFERTTAAWLANRILEWDLKDRKGNPIPVSEDAIRHLRPRLFRRVRDVIVGLEAPDVGNLLDMETEAKNLPKG